MSAVRKNRPGRGEVVAHWWQEELADRETGAARGLAARLRRAGTVETLLEPAVQVLGRRLGMGARDAGQLVLLAQALAEMRGSDPAPLARRLGAPTPEAEPVLSKLRFERLLRARDDEFATQLRRALIMADRRCHVARLADDLLLWSHPTQGDRIRAEWCFDYYGAGLPREGAAPGADAADTPAPETTAEESPA